MSALAAHGVETRLLGHTVGPTVTRFELELGPGVKVARVTSLAKDIAYAMASADVRILAPIPGKSAIGIEVPNRMRQLVTLGDVLASEEARKATHPLEVALGRDIAGRPVIENLADMPHILISGATGAGKSSCINSLITSIMMRTTPEELRLILVDPKRVELGQYNGLPHLLTQVVVDPKKAANALSWAVTEMERRYDVLAEAGMRDITGYNAAVDRGELDDLGPLAVGTAGRGRPGPTTTNSTRWTTSGRAGGGPVAGVPCQAVTPTVHRERLPFILIVVDELNDLMMVAARDVEESVCRIAQMARAVGIHLVLATQRPSVDVITGVIKANVPSRLAFSVSSLADSRVILDQPGAERLIGKGDMLLLTASSSVARRIQGPWVAESEVRTVVAHWQRQRGAEYVVGIAGDENSARRRRRPRRRRRTAVCGHGAGRSISARVHVDVAAQAPGGFLQGGTSDGPSRAPGGGGAVGGIQGPGGAHGARRARAASRPVAAWSDTEAGTAVGRVRTPPSGDVDRAPPSPTPLCRAITGRRRGLERARARLNGMTAGRPGAMAAAPGGGPRRRARGPLSVSRTGRGAAPGVARGPGDPVAPVSLTRPR